MPHEPKAPEGVPNITEARKLNKAELLAAYEQCYGRLLKDSQIDTNMDGVPDSDWSHDGTITIKAICPVVYVNCMAPYETSRLEPYIFATAMKLAESADAVDIRCSKNESLAFGAWRGALAAAVRESPPAEGTDYTVTCKGDEMAEIVVAALEGKFRIVRGF
jgi:hypothetical protein